MSNHHISPDHPPHGSGLLNKNALWRYLAIFLSIALVAGFAVVTQWASANEQSGTGDVASGFTPTDATNDSKWRDKLSEAHLLPINDELGYGWCIDLGLDTPDMHPDLFEEAEPKKLTHVTPLYSEEIVTQDARKMRRALTQAVPLEGQRRDSAIHMVKQLRVAYEEGDLEKMRKYNTALQMLLGTYSFSLDDKYLAPIAVTGEYRSSKFHITNDGIEEASGYRLKSTNDGRAYFEYTGKSEIPIEEAKESEYITVIAPSGYDLSIASVDPTKKNRAQRIIPIDQPGLPTDDKKPSEEPTSEKPSEEPTSEPSEEPTSEKPSEEPTSEPSEEPTSEKPSEEPTSEKPSEEPTSEKPSEEPTSEKPSEEPTSEKPSEEPTSEPSEEPTSEKPSEEPTSEKPSEEPTSEPSEEPTSEKPSEEPTSEKPSEEPTSEKPSEEPTSEKPSEEPTSEKPSEEPTTPEEPKNPSIRTKAEFADGATVVKAGAIVNDTVTYEDLVPGKKYTLKAQLIDKADGKTAVGKGEKAFTADKSGKGSVVVPIRVNDDVTEPVAAAVAFETLTSKDEEAQKNRAEKLTDGSAPSGDVIADHKDINDEAQTVNSAALRLKKFIGTDFLTNTQAESIDFSDFDKENNTGSLKLDDKSGATNVPHDTVSYEVVDAQNADAAFTNFAEKDKDGKSTKLKVTVAVKNTGGVALENVTVSDALTADDGSRVKVDAFDPPMIARLEPNAVALVTAEIDAPAADKLHGDVATATGTTPATKDAEGKDIPGKDISSNPDTAYAKIVTPKVELKKYIGAQKPGGAGLSSVAEAEALNDSQTEGAAHKASKAGEALTVAFVVENTGDVPLKDIATPTDAAIKQEWTNPLDKTTSGKDAGTPPVTGIELAGFAGNAEKQKLLKPGEKVVFVASLKAPGAGQLHADKAQSEGIPVKEVPAETPEGKPSYEEVAWTDAEGTTHEPGEVLKTNEDQAHAITPVTPSIGTTASFDLPEFELRPAWVTDETEVSSQLVAGSTVYDTVSYKDLVPGKEYMLTAELVERLGEGTPEQPYKVGRMLGADSVTFTASESGSGEVVVPVTVSTGFAEPVPAAVVFETLTSGDKDALAQRAPDEVLNGAPEKGGIVQLPKGIKREDVVAVHHDINDVAQTVVSKFTPEIGTVASFEDGKFAISGNGVEADHDALLDKQTNWPGSESVTLPADGRVSWMKVDTAEGWTGTVFDKVVIKNIVPGREYQLFGTLHRVDAFGKNYPVDPSAKLVPGENQVSEPAFMRFTSEKLLDAKVDDMKCPRFCSV